MALVLRHPEQQQGVTAESDARKSHSLHIIGTPPVGLLLELHSGLCVGNRAVLLVPVVVLHQGGDAVWIHQDVAAEERSLDSC